MPRGGNAMHKLHSAMAPVVPQHASTPLIGTEFLARIAAHCRTATVAGIDGGAYLDDGADTSAEKPILEPTLATSASCSSVMPRPNTGSTISVWDSLPFLQV